MILKLKYCFIIFFSFYGLIPAIGFAQTSKIKELSTSLLLEKTDSNRVTLLWKLAEQFQAYKPDTSLQLAQKALLLAQRIKFINGESHSLSLLATSQYLLGDYPNALNNYMLKLKIEEKRNSPGNYAGALNNIGITYILLEDYANALENLYRADSTLEAAQGNAKKDLKYSVEINIGEAYYRMKMADSATLHFSNALKIAKTTGDSASIGAALLGEANVEALKNDNVNALPYYRNAHSYLYAGNDADILCEVSLGMGKVYEKMSNIDSAIYFGNMSYSLAKKGKFLSRQLDASLFLSNIYYKANGYDSAYYYLHQSVQLKDSVKGNEKIKAAVILSINEKMRQQEIIEQKIREKETRYQQLQLLIIAICIPTLLLFTLLISRIKINKKLVTFMGIISLLFLFEFLTLLLHPLVKELTHHIPILELLIFVGVAALLVPAHHKLEQILLKRLTTHDEDRNKIRITTKRMIIKKQQ